MIRIAIVDDHSVVRSGLVALLQQYEDFEIVGTACNGEGALALCGDKDPDVVLMDLSMPGMDGVEATGRLRLCSPRARVLVLTSFSDRERIVAALRAGAAGYLLKDAEPEEIAGALRAAASGGAPMSPFAAVHVLSELRNGPAAHGDELSSREHEVLTLLADGLSNKEIARRLAITERTVKSHITSIFRTIGVQDRTQAALWVERRRSLPTQSLT